MMHKILDAVGLAVMTIVFVMLLFTPFIGAVGVTLWTAKQEVYGPTRFLGLITLVTVLHSLFLCVVFKLIGLGGIVL